MKVFKLEQKIQYVWTQKTDPEDTIRWNLNSLKDSTRLDSHNE